MTHPSRRAVLKGFGAAALGTLAVTGAAADHFDESQPEHVSISFDQSYLATYQPLLHLKHEDRQKLLGDNLYAWVASSPEFDTNTCVYWASYSHQDGWGDRDSHKGDHEPVQVEVDKQSGEIVRVRASIYHWLKGETVTPEDVPMDGTNPRLRVISPWHQYTAAAPGETVERFDLADLRDVYGAWLDNGLEEVLVPGASTNPWRMRSRSDFWREDFAGISTEAIYFNVMRAIGRGKVGSLEQ